MEYNIDKLAADMENESPESQEEANMLSSKFIDEINMIK